MVTHPLAIHFHTVSNRKQSLETVVCTATGEKIQPTHTCTANTHTHVHSQHTHTRTQPTHAHTYTANTRTRTRTHTRTHTHTHNAHTHTPAHTCIHLSKWALLGSPGMNPQTTRPSKNLLTSRSIGTNSTAVPAKAGFYTQLCSDRLWVCVNVCYEYLL